MLVPAHAEAEQPPAFVEEELVELRSEVERLRVDRDQAAQQIQELQDSLEALQSRVQEIGAAPAAAPVKPPTEAPKVATTKERSSRYQAERDILERHGGVLLPGGQLVLEPGLEYTNSKRNRIEISGFALIPAIVVGRIDSVEVDRNVFSGSLTARYGITDWLEFEADVPYIYRREREIFGSTGAEDQERLDAKGFGDINFGLFVHALSERADGWIPDTILNFRVRAPTGRDPFEISRDAAGTPTELPLGTGHWGLTGGATIVKTVDPAVMFGSLNYQWNLAESTSNFGRVDLGNSWDYALGFAFALNERVASSLTWQHRLIGRTSVNGEKIRRTDINDGRLFAGLSYSVNEYFTFNISVGIGVTEDAPDASIQLRMPLRIPYRFPTPKVPDWLELPWF